MSWSDDDEVIENWEDLDQADFEEQLELILKSKQKSPSNSEKVNVIMLGDDAFRSQYVPKAPVLKILKRPSHKGNGSGQSDDSKPKPIPKTLQQREQEYAEARLRILGLQLCNDSDDCFRSINNITEKDDENKEAVYNLVQVIRLPKAPDGTKGFHQRKS